MPRTFVRFLFRHLNKRHAALSAAMGVGVGLAQWAGLDTGNLLELAGHIVGMVLVIVLTYRVLALGSDPSICPLCHGEGRRINPLMTAEANRTAETCHCCKGRGVLWRPRDAA